MLCVCGLCVVFLCVISVFVFGGVFLCWVGLVVSYLVWTSLRLRNSEWILKLFTVVLGLELHILPKFQFWN